MKVREGSGTSADPAYRGYLRFTVSGLTGAAASVKLRLYVTDASSNSLSVYPIANTTWTESGLTYANAPAIAGSTLATTTAPATNAYVESPCRPRRCQATDRSGSRSRVPAPTPRSSRP